MNQTLGGFSPGDHHCTIQQGERERSYLVHIPNRVESDSPPVVLVFHGSGTNAEGMVRFSGMNQTADAEGFVVVYPNGTGPQPHLRSWNAGHCCAEASEQNVDDVGFVEAILDEIPAKLSIDPSRIYVTGMSNGGMFCYLLADRLSERIAAMASVSGPMGLESCAPKVAVPILHIQGTEDYFTPIEGGRGKRSTSRTEFNSVRQTMDCWIEANRCESVPLKEQLPALVDDGTSVSTEVYSGKGESAEVKLVTIQGGGHTWPGRNPPSLYLGKSTRNLSANEMIWEFFQRHRRPESPAEFEA